MKRSSSYTSTVYSLSCTTVIAMTLQGGSSCVVTLAKVRLGAAVLLEVTIVQYQRGLVFCGTSQGKYFILLSLSLPFSL